MRKLLFAGAAVAALGACAQLQTYGAVAVEQRRQMNDMQARLTMAATCDISLGAFYRELSAPERQFAGLVCGGIFPTDETASED
jgi:hypothetical protein